MGSNPTRANFLYGIEERQLKIQCSRFISVFAFVSHHNCFKHSLAQVITLVAEYIDKYDITTEGFLEVSIESWPGWLFEPTTTEFRSAALTD